MRPVDTSTALARLHDHDVRRAACDARLAALAACARAATSAGQRSTGHLARLRRRPTVDSPCT